jgi:RNA polymerase sigma-70 factor (ECF subfamily)
MRLVTAPTGIQPVSDPGLGGTVDEALVARAAAGDVPAFEELVRRYQDRVHNFALRWTGNPADAEEVTQEAFLKAFRALPRFRGDAKFSTWLFQIAKNVCINLFHRGRRQMEHRRVSLQDHMDDDEAIPVQIETPDDNPQEALLEREFAAVAAQAIAALDPHYRDALVLRDVEGMDYAEIAQILEVPVGTVKSRIHRARSELQKRLLPYVGEVS